MSCSLPAVQLDHTLPEATVGTVGRPEATVGVFWHSQAASSLESPPDFGHASAVQAVLAFGSIVGLFCLYSRSLLTLAHTPGAGIRLAIWPRGCR